MDNPAEFRRIVASLGAELRQPSLFGAKVGGVAVEPIGDPILRELAEKPDWREYEEMWCTPEIYDPWRHMTASVLSEPFEIQPASNRPAAKLLANAAQWMWSSLPTMDRAVVLQRLLDADWFGWRPMQCLLAESTWASPTGGRRSMWIPKRIIDKPPHHFRWTTDPERRLVFLPGRGGDVRLFSPEEVRAGWMVPRVRSLDDPYGRGLASYCWMMWKVAASVSRRFYTSVDREWNMVHLKLSDLGATEDLRTHMQQLQADLSVLSEMLATKSVLINPGRFETTFIDKLEFIQSGVELMQHIKTCLQTLIEGQTLTSETRTAGPAGSSVVHQEVKAEYAKMTFASTVEAAMSQLFRDMFWLNFGEEVDPSDLPSFVSWLRLRLIVTTARALYDMGLPLRGRRMAELLGAGSIVDAVAAIEADDDEILVQKDTSGSKVLESPADSEVEANAPRSA